VVDPIDLLLGEPTVQQLVEPGSGRPVHAERFLDHHPRPSGAVDDTDLAEAFYRVLEDIGRDGEVERPVAAETGGILDLADPRRQRLEAVAQRLVVDGSAQPSV